LQDVPDTSVTPIEALCVDTIEVAHPTREVCVRRLDQKVIVVGHQAVAVTYPVEALYYISHPLQKRAPIVVIDIDILSSIAARGYVIDCAFVFDSQWSCHGLSIAGSMSKDKI
jgi:hypothetical protein